MGVESARWIAGAWLTGWAAWVHVPGAHAQGSVPPQVRAGEVRIDASGSTTRINQQSQRSIIDWTTFSVANGQRVEFNLPSSSAISLNRVTGASPARIDGDLQSNGQVWLLSPAGVLIGPSGQVVTRGFLASTQEMSDQAFLQGQYRLSAGSANGLIDHRGTIRALDGGYAILSGASVRSSGVIEARLGEVVIASSRALTVDLAGDRLLSFAVDGLATPAAGGAPAIEISGRISAHGGRVSLSARAATDVIRGVINVSGVVEAGRAVERNGEIVLEAGPAVSARIDEGRVAVTGRFDKRGGGTLAVGGALEVEGQLAVSEGRIERLAGGRVGSAATAVDLAAGATLDLSQGLPAGQRLALGAPTGAGTLAIGSNRLDLHVEAMGVSFEGSITGAGGRLYKYGDGSLTLTGTSSYSGGTWLVEGLLGLAGPHRNAAPGTPGPIGTGLLYADLGDDARRAWERAIARELTQAAERARQAAERLASLKELPTGPTILPDKAAEALLASQSVGGTTRALNPSGTPGVGSEPAGGTPGGAPPPPPSASAAPSSAPSGASSGLPPPPPPPPPPRRPPPGPPPRAPPPPPAPPRSSPPGWRPPRGLAARDRTASDASRCR